MDVNTWRIIVTVLGFACFLGICFWAYSRHARKGFDEAAMLPFTEDDDMPASRDDGHKTQGKQHG
jgi:cytochrome c oxidase cbb3-type subunit IV